MGDLLGYRKKLGFLVPAFNTVAIADMHQIVLTGVTIQLSDFCTDEIDGLAPALSRASQRMVAKAPDSVMALIDEDFTGEHDRTSGDRSLLEPARPGGLPSHALFAALDHYGTARRIAVISPFPATAHRRAVARIADAGYSVVGDATLDIARPTGAAQVTYARMRDLYESATSAGSPELVIQLGHNLPMARLAGNLEEDFARPFLAINQVCLWHSLRISGVNDLLPGASRLFMDF